ncbi:MAG TPA: DUF1175 family protein [Bryobacteraceae bacterium]|nr:DUF1175 family protein [Bryobacteraceae bacterium]
MHLVIRSPAERLALGVTAALILGLVWARPGVFRARPSVPHLRVAPAELAADGYDTAVLTIESPSGAAPRIAIDRPHAARVADLSRADGQWEGRIRAGVLPGRITVRVQFPGAPAATAAIEILPDASDSAGDGTPDFLRLQGRRDTQAFRRWFTFVAEAQYFQDPARRPAEIDDCAALIRYAYREALHAHDGAWAQSAALPLVPAFDSVAKYQYPFTPLGASLFRVTAGPFQASDAGGTAFAQFADAQTLCHRNSFCIGRDVTRALPGDLLFFHQPTGHMVYHSMIYLGESQLRPDGNRYLLYHTGPDGANPGEIRRWTVAELQHYPEPEWRPVDSNPAFLGVYRWNILRKVAY